MPQKGAWPGSRDPRIKFGTYLRNVEGKQTLQIWYLGAPWQVLTDDRQIAPLRHVA